MISAVGGKLISGGIKAAAGLGKTIASAIDAGDKQAEARRIAEMLRKYEARREDRKYQEQDEDDARFGDEIMRKRAAEEENKQLAASREGYQRGQRTIDQRLSMLNNNPALRERTLELLRR